MFKRLVQACLIVAAQVSAAAAFACPICLPPQGGSGASLGQIAGSAVLVLAEPQSEPRRMRISAVIKGRAKTGEAIMVAYADMPRAPFEAGKAVLLARHPLLGNWQPIGAVAPEREAWLRGLMSLAPTGELTAQEWPARVNLFAADLFAEDSFVAQIAADQIARAPYGAMRALRGSLDGARLVEAAGRIENIPRLPLLILLMGIAGDEPARDFVRRRLASAGALAGADERAALMTATIEIEGAPALAQARTTLLAGDARAREIEATMLALRVVGGAAGPQGRQAIVDIYRDALRVRPDVAGLVARDMEDWGDWSLAADIAPLQEKTAGEGAGLLIRSYLEAASSSQGKFTGER